MRLAFSLSAQFEVMDASLDLIEKAVLLQDIGRSDPEDHATYLAVSVLAFRATNDMRAAKKLLNCGYFVQAASLLRDIAEIGMLALYFAEFPERLPDWRRSEGTNRHNRYGRSKLRKAISEQGKFEYLDQYFDLFSEYGTHPSSASIMAHHDGQRFYVGPHFNETIYRRSIMDLASLVWHVTDACGSAYRSLFNTSLEDALAKELARFSKSWDGIAP
ncbi:hypothetical protein DFR48_102455 [Ciceribacter lividus]|uniref:Uncharacterized protein n=1 Tax=Ciceribacter lividus TaxID=1197950 RepID=A0A6I7HQE6_9HYPH|nr:hypothetical protein [Ciceribacter lividus]RCW27961.1 hypothetical protein DFR48_102455 [Ciceribacter lividus]